METKPCHPDRLPAQPLTDWLDAELERFEARADLDTTPREALRRRLGVDEKLLRRWLRGHGSNDRPTVSHPAPTVEDALHRAGVFTFEVYPHALDDVEVREGYCLGCDERVLADEAGRCLWCDMTVELEAVPA